MRRAAGLLLGLILVAWILTEVPVANTHSAAAEWKRTVDGWELSSTWATGPYVKPVRVHPVLVGTLVLLLCSIALLALPIGSRPAKSVDTAWRADSHHARPKRSGRRRRVLALR